MLTRVNLASISGRVGRVSDRLFAGKDLRAKVARGGAWLGGGSFVEQVSRFARNMLMARLLAPSAFGSMAIVMSSASLIASFSDVGVLPAIIQNPRGADREYLNAAWWLGMLRAAFMYATIFTAAPLIAHFYGNPELIALLRVALLSMIFDGMLSPRAKLAHKEMKFGRWAFISNGGAICGVALTIALSFILRDVWALAIGFCSENIFRCLFSYILYPASPSLNWDKHAFGDLLKFSKGMIGLSFLNLLFARTDIFVLGKLHSAELLGHLCVDGKSRTDSDRFSYQSSIPDYPTCILPCPGEHRTHESDPDRNDVLGYFAGLAGSDDDLALWVFSTYCLLRAPI